MNTFIEFGAPRPNDYNYLRAAKLFNYRTIVIDFLYYDFMEDDYYKLLVDETYINYWSDFLDIPLADKWVCHSSLEHTPKDIVDREIEGIKSKIKGKGEIGIDLTDHEGGFLLDSITEPYLNGISLEQWVDIISQNFTFSNIVKIPLVDRKWIYDREEQKKYLNSIGHIVFNDCQIKI